MRNSYALHSYRELLGRRLRLLSTKRKVCGHDHHSSWLLMRQTLERWWRVCLVGAKRRQDRSGKPRVVDTASELNVIPVNIAMESCLCVLLTALQWGNIARTWCKGGLQNQLSCRTNFASASAQVNPTLYQLVSRDKPTLYFCSCRGWLVLGMRGST